jgi:hypothetical protein
VFALQNLQADPRYFEAWKTASRLRDVEPMKALHMEYGVPWVEEMVSDEKTE